ncbi:hypothetical protein ES707_04423 [subsurface metagenome]
MAKVAVPEVELPEGLVVEAKKYKTAQEFIKEGEYDIRRVRLTDLTPEELALVRKAGYNIYYKDLYTQYAEGIDYVGLDPSVPSTFPLEVFPEKLREVKQIPSGLRRGKTYNPLFASPEKFWIEATRPAGSNPGKELWEMTELVGNLKKGAWVQLNPEGRMYQITDIGRTRATLVDGEGNRSTIPIRQAVYPLEPNPPAVEAILNSMPAVPERGLVIRRVGKGKEGAPWRIDDLGSGVLIEGGFASRAEANKAIFLIRKKARRAGRQDWQLSQIEYVRLSYPRAVGKGAFPSLEKEHEILIRKALSEGKLVPTEVLADYPDLVTGSNPGLIGPIVAATVECPICDEVIEIPQYDKVTRSDALSEHIGKEHTGYRARLGGSNPMIKEGLTKEQITELAIGTADKLLACVRERAHSILMLHSLPYSEDRQGIVVNEAEAKASPCRCTEYRPGKKLCFSKGIIGALSDEQKESYCPTTVFVESAGLEKRFEDWMESIGTCRTEIAGIVKGERLDPWLGCMSRELTAKGMGASGSGGNNPGLLGSIVAATVTMQKLEEERKRKK